MSDDSELKRRFLQVQQNQPIRRLDSAEFQKAHLGGVKTESRSQSVTQPQIQEPEEITRLKAQIQELEQIVAIEEERGREAFREAKNDYKQARAEAPAKRVILEAAKKAQELELKNALNRGEQVGDDFKKKRDRLKVSEVKIENELVSQKNLVKELKRLPVARAFQFELEEAKTALSEAEIKWQKELNALDGRSEELAKPDAAAINRAFDELKNVYTEMFQVNAGNKTSLEKEETILKFDQMSTEFKEDFLKADLNDQKKTIDTVARIARLDKMSDGFKKGLVMENPKEPDDLSKQFSDKVQEVEKLVREERAREFKKIRESTPEIESASKQQKPNSLRTLFNKMSSGFSSSLQSTGPRDTPRSTRNNIGPGSSRGSRG
jgi:hypothetical protein